MCSKAAGFAPGNFVVLGDTTKKGLRIAQSLF
jgi:hypothetical protein